MMARLKSEFCFILLNVWMIMDVARGDVLRIGTMIESSGGWQAGDDAHVGAELAQEAFRTAGTVLGDWALDNGHSITFVGFQNDTACAVWRAMRLGSVDLYPSGIDASIGPGCSGSSISVATLAQAYQVPMVSFASQATGLESAEKYPYFFRTATNAKVAMFALAKLAASKGVLQVAAIVENHASGFFLSMARVFTDKIVGLGGSEAAFTSFELTKESVVSAVAKVSSATVVGIFTGSYTTGSNLLFENCGTLCGVGFAWFSPSNNMDSFDAISDVAKLNMPGLYVGAHGFPATAFTTKFLAGPYLGRLKSKYGPANRKLAGVKTFGLFAYDAVTALAWAWKVVKDGGADNIHAAFRRGKVDFASFSGRVRFGSENNDVYEQVTTVFNLQDTEKWAMAATYSYFGDGTESLTFVEGVELKYTGGATSPPPVLPCPPGTLTSEGVGRCIQCGQNTYGLGANAKGISSCKQCPTNTGTVGARGSSSAMSCKCNAGFFHRNGSTFNGLDPCRPCPEGGQCDGGDNPVRCRAPTTWVTVPDGSLREILTLEETTSEHYVISKHPEARIVDHNGTTRRSGWTGTWVDFVSGSQPRVLSCRPASACLGGSNCSCARGHDGIRCEQCIQGWYKAGSGTCTQCQRGDSDYGTTLTVGLLLSLLAVSLIYVMFLQFALAKDSSDQIAIAIWFLQQITLLLSFKLPWPTTVMQTKYAFEWATVDVFSYLPLECAFDEPSLAMQLLFRLMLPVFVGLMFLSFYWLRVCLNHTCAEHEDADETDSKGKGSRITEDLDLLPPPAGPQKKFKRRSSVSVSKMVGTKKKASAMMHMKYQHIQAFLLFLMFSHLALSTPFISFFECDRMSTGQFRLLSNPSIVCYDGVNYGEEWLAALPCAIAGLLVYAFGLPVFYGLIFVWGKRNGFGFKPLSQSLFTRKLLKCTGEMEDGGAEELDNLFKLMATKGEDDFDDDVLSFEEFNALLLHIGINFTQSQTGFLLHDIGCEHETGIPFETLRNLVGAHHASFDAKFRPIWLKFRPDKAYYELVLALQVVSMLCAKAWSSQSQELTGFVMMMLLLSFFIAHARQAPFRTKLGNDTVFFSYAILIVVLTCGMSVACMENASERRAQIQVFVFVTLCVGFACHLFIVTIEILRNARKGFKEGLVQAQTAVMASVPIFEDCSPDFVTDVSVRLVKAEFADGFQFASLGDVGEAMWILMSGVVEQTDESGQTELLTATDAITPAFGEVAMLDEQPRKYSFVAHGPCTVNVLKKSELKKCFATWPVAEATVLTAVLNKYNYEAKRDYTVLPHKDLIDKVAITLDEMSGPALVVAKEDKRHAVLEVRRRLTSVS